jgi:hypothetical protein
MWHAHKTQNFFLLPKFDEEKSELTVSALPGPLLVFVVFFGQKVFGRQILAAKLKSKPFPSTP